MKGYIANTDFDWYRYLAQKAELDEVNFWRPLGGTAFQALSTGEPFFFKLKKAHGNAIAGFGFFVMFRPVGFLEAWESFGDRNGAPSQEVMWQRIRHYVQRNRGETPRLSHTIGCILIASPIFFPRELWVQGPSDWHQSIVAGKGYDISHGEGRRIWEECVERAHTLRLGASAEYNLSVVRDVSDRYGREQVFRPRLGQGTFRFAVEQAYRKCAVTREHSLPALEAAHIVPYAQGGLHEVSNGLLLRADLHKLYDRGYVTVTPDYEFRVSERLRDEYHNGKVYYALEGARLVLPSDPRDWPKRENLAFHAESVYQE